MRTFYNSSIRTKLSAGFGLALTLVIVVGLFSLVQLQSVFSVTRNFRDVWLPRTELLGEIKRIGAEHKLLANRRVQTTNFRQLATIATSMRTATEKLDKGVSGYLNYADSAHEKVLLSSFRSSWDAYLRSLDDVQHRLEIGELTAANREFNQTSLTAYQDAVGSLDQLITYSDQQSAVAAAQAGSVYRNAILLTIGVIVLAAIGTFGAIVWTARNVTSPILRVSDAMRQLTAGNENVTVVEDRERRDEIGILAAAVDGYRTSIARSRELANEAECERERLQAAISNMPIGLTMFDASRRLIVCNSRFAEMYNLPDKVTVPGTPLLDIMRARMGSGDFADGDPEAHIERVLANVSSGKPSLNLVELKDGRVLSIIHQPMEGGGWVATHEDVTERRRAEARIHHMARHDALTDLANRTLFRDCVEEALKRVDRGESLAVMSLDLDRFKAVNDTLGHPIGDSLLIAVADRLRACIREVDSVARFGGDEFAVVQVGVEQPAGAISLAERIIEQLSAPYDVDDHQVVIGVSVGIALAPDDSRDAEQLLKNGDMALYRAKCEGRGIYRFFEPEMDARMQARRLLELDLRKALANHEFEIHYQPIINLRSNEVAGFEALIRWRHPERGMVPPNEFISLAEEIGLIVPIGEWVIRQACADAARWPDDIRISVNISPAQFRNKNLIGTVVSALANSKVPAARLELEITEGVLLNDHEETLATLHQLRALGVHIAMDDFGTGYSSLSYLRSFPFDKIKIDRSFIGKISAEESSLAIIRAVTGLSTSLGMVTTAEGVETKDQLAQLRTEGCTEVQGFLFSAARPADEVLDFIDKMHARGEAAA